jgi:di/tricarboxylate transporter
MAGALLNLLGDSPFGLLYLVPLAMMFLLLRILSAQERAQAKKKAPGRSARPGA